MLACLLALKPPCLLRYSAGDANRKVAMAREDDAPGPVGMLENVVAAVGPGDPPIPLKPSDDLRTVGFHDHDPSRRKYMRKMS
jgi:hypothetical protein